MSFQGDVRGIGLAELLQGLARGRKEGSLTLTARSGLRSVIGIEDGKAWMMPDPDEDPDTWRERVHDAWADDPTLTIEAWRLEQVVRAARLEVLYALLDGGGVHFRFEPGSLGARTTQLQEDGAPTTEIHCKPIPVEFMLLEYARIADELESRGESAVMYTDVVPCIHDHTELGAVPPTLVEQCNGNSTVQEIADRLGWTVRQVRLELARPLEGGGLRLAHPIEVLRLALYELERKEFSRAGTRLSHWTRIAPPGPFVPEDAEALSNEWLAGRLTAALRRMRMRDVRCILRRLDHSLGNVGASLVHWTEASRISRNDRIVRLHHTAMRFRAEGDAPTLDAREVLDLAREMREHGSAWRSGPLLTIAAHRQPTSTGQRLELGMGLLATRRAEDAGPWIVAACEDILAQGHADRVLGPLRQLLELDPRNREARQLLTRAKRSSTQTKRLRRNLLIGTAIVAVAAGGAFVRVHSERARVDKLDQVKRLLDEPIQGLARLDEHFATDASPEIHDLRRELEERLRAIEIQLRTAWLDEFHAIQQAAKSGDVTEVPAMLKALPKPPRMHMLTEPWPDRGDVLLAVAQRLRNEVTALGAASDRAPQQVVTEKRVLGQTAALRAAIGEGAGPAKVHAEFVADLDEIDALIASRDETRSIMSFEREKRERQEEDDRLLQLARSSDKEGQYARSLRHYEEIVAGDPTGKVRRVLASEIDAVRKKVFAVERARDLAVQGRHAAAKDVLVDAFQAAGGVMLPFRVTSEPTGASVRVDGGAPRTTPFVIEGTFDDHWDLVAELPGFEPLPQRVDGPRDTRLLLSRVPERSIRLDGRIEAVPVAIGGDHIVVDRRGNLARIGPGGVERWRIEIDTLSGVARAPVELPSRPGKLLFTTETGTVWILDAAEGQLEGPWELGSPPVAGPATVGSEVHVVLKNGKLARWRSSLRPQLEGTGAGGGLGDHLRFGETFGATIARGREQSSARVEAPNGNWYVEVDTECFRVRRKGYEVGGFPVSRTGTWSLLAWTPPTADAPDGRLWIADEGGLRAIVPELPPAR